MVFTSSLVGVGSSEDLERHPWGFWGVDNVPFLDLSGAYVVPVLLLAVKLCMCMCV